MVVAEGDASSYTVADRGGAFTLFNVSAGANSVRGYRGGLQVVPQDIDVSANVDGVILELSGDGLGSVSGSVNIVNAPGNSATSVVLIPSSLFIESFEFGPRALRPARARARSRGRRDLELDDRRGSGRDLQGYRVARKRPARPRPGREHRWHGDPRDQRRRG